jgi:hypothetical protein
MQWVEEGYNVSSNVPLLQYHLNIAVVLGCCEVDWIAYLSLTDYTAHTRDARLNTVMQRRFRKQFGQDRIA